MLNDSSPCRHVLDVVCHNPLFTKYVSRPTSILLILLVVWSYAIASGASHAATPVFPKNGLLIGVVCPLTPSSRAFGIGHLQAVTQAVDEFNAHHGNVVRVRIADDQSDPARGVAAVREMQDAGAAAILGPCNSSVAKGILDKGEVRLPLVSALTTASELTEPGRRGRYFFRMNVSDRTRVHAFMEALFDAPPSSGGARPERLLMYYEDGDTYGEGLLSDAKKWLLEKQPDMLASRVRKVAYRRDITADQARTLVTSEKDAGWGRKSDAIVLLGLETDALTLSTAMIEQKTAGQIYLPEPEQNVFRGAAKGGVKVAGIRVFSVWDPSDTAISKFTPEFERRFASKPTFAASLGYDSTNILLWAITRVLETPGAGEIPLQTLRDRIAKKLGEFDPRDVSLVLNGDQRLSNGEYTKLKFRGLQFRSDGELVSWNEQLRETPAMLVSGKGESPVPGHVVGALSALFGILGSLCRSFHKHDQSPGRLPFLHLFREGRFLIRTLAIDPAMAMLAFSAVYLGVIATKPDLLHLASPDTIFFLAAFVLGLPAGYMGVRMFTLIIARLGLSERDDKGDKPGAVPEPAVKQI